MLGTYTKFAKKTFDQTYLDLTPCYILLHPNNTSDEVLVGLFIQSSLNSRMHIYICECACRINQWLVSASRSTLITAIFYHIFQRPKDGDLRCRSRSIIDIASLGCLPHCLQTILALHLKTDVYNGRTHTECGTAIYGTSGAVYNHEPAELVPAGFVLVRGNSIRTREASLRLHPSASFSQRCHH